MALTMRKPPGRETERGFSAFRCPTTKAGVLGLALALNRLLALPQRKLQPLQIKSRAAVLIADGESSRSRRQRLGAVR